MLGFIFFLSTAWVESFETQNFFPPNYWLIVNEDCLDAFWFRDITTGYTGNHSAMCYADTSYAGLAFTNLDYLITPRVLPQLASLDTILGFWYKTSMPGCSLDIMITTSSPPDMSAFNSLQTFISADTFWQQGLVSLTSYSGLPVYMAFRARNMQRDQQVWLDDIWLPDMTGQPSEYNGRLRTKGPPSQKYLLVWGSHYEMGYAHGYLLGEEAVANLERFAIGNTSLHMVSPAQYEYAALPYFRLRFTTAQKYQDEAQGMINGCLAKGVDLYHEALGRDITVEDILCLNSLCDFGCSSISGWGESTTNDDTLQGGLVMARDLDYSTGQYTSLGNTSVIIGHVPDVPDEQRFVSITMAGIFGCLSGVNENGVGLCCDYGYNTDTTYIPPNSLTPFILSCRNAIETADLDSSGVNDIYDITQAIHDSTSLRCWDVHLFSPYDLSHPVPVGILEINNIGDSLRLVSDNSIAPQIISDWNLCVTNHERVLYPPVYCYRYQVMADSLNDDMHLNTRRAIAIENAVAGWGYYAGTVQSMAIRANIITAHPDWPCIGVSYARRNQGAHVFNHLYYSWEELFSGLPGIEEHGSVPSKKSFFGPTIFTGSLHLPLDKDYKVFNAVGREVNANSLIPGIYFIEIDGLKTVKVIKLK
ncbi:MAG: choice-of-anchor J domain-containing protein [bacterium]